VSVEIIAPSGAISASAAHTTAVARDKPTLIGLSRSELAAFLGAIGVPEKQQRMRVSQLWRWIYTQGVRDFDAMTNATSMR